MSKGLCLSLAAALTAAGVALGQGPVTQSSPTTPTPDVVDAASPLGIEGSSAVPAVEEAPAAPPGPLFWTTAEYLRWRFKSSPVSAPLLTTTTNPASVPTAGLGQVETNVVLGGRDANIGWRDGARFTGGFWIDCHRSVGFEGGYFCFASHTTSQAAQSSGLPGSPILAIPFFDVDAVAENTFLLATPGIQSGSATLSLTTRLQGTEANGVVKVCCCPDLQVEVLGGFRFLDLNETLNYTTTSLGIQPPGPGSNQGLLLRTLDQFDDQNLFFGAQLGGRVEYRLGNLFVNAKGLVALGDMYTITRIRGYAVTNFFNAPAGGPFTGVPVQVLSGTGTFAQPTNAGNFILEQFTAAAELTVNAGYQLTPWLRLFAGYDLLYLSSVLRPGNQIDRQFSVAQTIQGAIAGVAPAPGTNPIFPPNGSRFWAQGVNLGLTFSY